MPWASLAARATFRVTAMVRHVRANRGGTHMTMTEGPMIGPEREHGPIESRYDPSTGRAKEREIDSVELAFRMASFREQVDTFNMQREVIATLTESEANLVRSNVSLVARLRSCEEANRELLAQLQAHERRGF